MKPIRHIIYYKTDGKIVSRVYERDPKLVYEKLIEWWGGDLKIVNKIYREFCGITKKEVHK